MYCLSAEEPSPDFVSEAINAGMIKVLNKPVDILTLQRLLEHDDID